MRIFLQNVRFAARLLRRSPGFAVAVIAVLGSGIAASTTLFSIVNAVILRPLPFADPGRLVAVVPEDRAHHFRGASSPPDFVDFRSVPAFAQVAATAPWKPAATGRGEPERLRGLLVSPNFFSMLGVAAARGRTFSPDEEMPGREHVVVLSDSLWRRKYGSDPAVVGRQIPLNGEPYTVVGIAPASFHWGRSYGRNGSAEIWGSFALTPARLAAGERGDEYLDLVARLRRGVSLSSAQAEVDSLIRRFQHDYPEQFPPASTVRTSLVPLQRDLVGETRRPLWILFGAVGFLLVIACTNVAGLLLARAAQRRGEIAIRVSLGASRRRIFGQLLAESALVAAISAAVGIAGGWAALRSIGRHLPSGFPGVAAPALDRGSVLFVLAVAAVTSLVFGLVPLAGSVRFDVRQRIDEGRGVASRGEARLRRALVAGQLAIAGVLLAGASLLAVSLSRVLGVDPGFDPRGVVTGELTLARTRYPDAEKREAFRSAVLDRLRSTPGVREVGAVSILPLGGNGNSGTFDIEGKPDLTGDRRPHADLWAATPGYFPAMRIALRRGRLFTDADRAASPQVAIIDEALARAYFGSQDPVGRRIDFQGDIGQRRWREIIGVVRTVRARALDEPTGAALYVPFSQSGETILTLVARVEGDPATYAKAIRAAVAAVDPDQPLGTVAPLASLVSESVAERRIAATLLAGFALTALFLAAIGLYGVLAYSVTRRRREIGVRVALGALPASIASLVLRESGRMIGAGLVGGLAAALLLTRFLSSLLFGVGALDPKAFLLVAVALGGIGLLASSIPAVRAAHIPPMEALRDE